MVYRTQIHTDFQDSKHKTLTAAIISIFYKVYNTLGYGFLEKVYENAMIYELKKAGIPAVSQPPIAVMYEDEIMGEYFADILVDDKVIVEIKASRSLAPDHKAQLLNYLKATDKEVGLLLNFGPKPEISRKVFDNNKK
jgi:GxxExxY protein